MPRPPPEFRRRAVELAHQRAKLCAELARDRHRRELPAELDQREHRRGPWRRHRSEERGELVELRRKLRVAELEIAILRRAAAYFARENVLPK